MATNPTLQNLRIGHLEYNGFTFPALSDISATIKPEYDSGDNSVKWYVVELNVSFIYYPTAEDLPSTIDLSNGKSYTDSSYLPTYMANIASDLRNRLLQPKQPFAFNGMGFGTINYNTTGVTIGPGVIPLECTWAPIAGNIVAQFTWKCLLHLAPGCANSINNNGILNLNYSVTWESSEETGFQFIRSIQGEIEFINDRTNLSIAVARPRASTNMGSLNVAIRDKIYPILRQLFPKPAGYKRSRRMSIGENQRTFSFTFTDAEIMKDVAPPRPILDLNMRNPIQSDINAGFGIWKVGFNGDVTVAKARTQTSFASQKKLAWVIIGRMISQRLQAVSGYFYTEAGNYSQKRCTIFLDNIQIEDFVNENGFSFSLQYRIFADEKTIIKASGIFNTLGLPGETWERREQYLQSIQAGVDPITPWPQDRPPLFDACSTPTIAPYYEGNDDKQDGSMQEQATVKTLPVEESHIWFENDYEVEELNQSSIHVPLSNSQEARREVVRNQVPRGLVPVSDSGSSNAPLPVVTNPTAKTYVITMYGRSIRAGVPTTPPNLVSYGGKPCIKIGSDKVRVKEHVVGVVLDPSRSTTSIYKTSWSKKYLVYGNLSSNQVAYRLTDRNSGDPNQSNNNPIA